MYFYASLILRVAKYYIGHQDWAEDLEECDVILLMIMRSSAMEDL